MATLILTTVGTIVGGPVGGALGAVLGHAVDARVLAPKGRQGPRLGDLSLQTSSYGTALPRLFGTLRVAGTVVWATDLREDRHKQGGGKGRPTATTYSYSASFAVALSARRVMSVGRIWADGKLLRGAAGDWKSELGGFRLYDGGEDQPVDPAIASAEGETPAYRGLALAVFEDLQLADFGNRIPSLTFEVTADDAALGVGDIASVLSDGAVTGATPPVFAGYAASGDSVRGAIEALTDAFPVALHDDGAVLVLSAEEGAGLAVSADPLGAHAGDTRVARRTVSRGADLAAADEIAVTYYEPARDWQAGVQRARSRGAARKVERIELPAALAAADAKAVAERALAKATAARRTATIRLPMDWMTLKPGMRLTVAGLAGGWRAATVTVEQMAVEVRLVGDDGAPGMAASAVPGRATMATDAVAGHSVIVALDLPPLDDAGVVPALWIAAAGSGAGWRRATLSLSRDAGASWTVIGPTAAPAVIGTVLVPPAAGDPAVFDRAGTIEIVLLNDAMWLESRDDDALAAGANLAMLGGELIQFGGAEPIGPRRFRLTRLLRGRRGTEDRIAGHQAGEAFVLVERQTLMQIPLDAAAIGAPVLIQAIGPGDAADGVTVTVVPQGAALRTPAPVHLRATRAADGTIALGWTRRSRAGWAWTDGGDAPLTEPGERYRVTAQPAGGGSRTIERDTPDFIYDAAMQAADGGVPGGAVTFTIAQTGGPVPGNAAPCFLAGDDA